MFLVTVPTKKFTGNIHGENNQIGLGKKRLKVFKSKMPTKSKSRPKAKKHISFQRTYILVPSPIFVTNGYFNSKQY